MKPISIYYLLFRLTKKKRKRKEKRKITKKKKEIYTDNLKKKERKYSFSNHFP